MARIPVERKRRGIPWWAWLLIALAIAALLWMIFALVDDDEPRGDLLLLRPAASATSDPAAGTAAAGTTTTPDTLALPPAVAATATTASDQPAAGATITDPLQIITTPDQQSLIGRPVQLGGVPVQEVAGDAAFWVGPSQGEQLLVILDEVPTPNQPTEGRYDINPGQTITIFGELRAFPGIAEAKEQWGVADESKLADEQIYLHADRVEFAAAAQPATEQPAVASPRERFQQFWEQNGGLEIFGYPLTEPLEQNGRTVQYFERARLELHPENPQLYQIVPGRVGAEVMEARGIPWQSQAVSSAPVAGCLYFPETQHNVCNQQPGTGFLNYWLTHGVELDGQPGASYAESLALFGKPLSEPYLYATANGEVVQVQWFERARFEWHPGNRPETQVLLGRLGAELLEQQPVQ